MGNQFKPAILQCFGDISQAILGAFETYLPIVGQVLQQASSVSMTTEANFEMMDYITSLREGIMDAWDGIIIAMKSSGKSMYPAPVFRQIVNDHSSNTRPILGLYLRAPAHCPDGHQPHRGPSPVIMRRYWVCAPRSSFFDRR